MISSINALQQELLASFTFIDSIEQNTIRKHRMYVEAIALRCRQLTKLLISGTFDSVEDEIEFFKVRKAFFYSELYFHEELLEIEMLLHTLNQNERLEFLTRKLNEVINFMTSSGNRELYQYYLSGSSDLDHHYFTRSKKPKEKYRELRNLTEWDHITSTGYDFLFAKLIAFETLSSYLRTEIAKSNGTTTQASFMEGINSKNLKWTRTKIDLIELGYFIKFTNGINGGTVETKDIMDSLSKLFSTDLSNYSDVLGDIRNRKKDRFKLYEETIKNFLNYIDEEALGFKRRTG